MNYRIDQLDAVLRNDFPAFIEKCFATLFPTETYQRNWHLEAMAWALELVRRGFKKRLMINMPPRMMKSFIVSVAFTAWYLGEFPGRRIIVASYSEDLAKLFSRQTRTIMQAPWYRRVFPRTVLSKSKQTELEITTTAGGGRLGCSLGGQLTGRGGNLIILDDPTKADDVMSEAERRRVNRLFFNTFFTRTDNMRKDAIILVGQRLHVDDLFGNVLKRTKDWHRLNLPAVADHETWHRIGERRRHRRKVRELLHPDRMSIADLEERKRALGGAQYSAQYQQDPQPLEGALIKRGWLKRYIRPPDRSAFWRVVMSADTGTKTGEEHSYSVVTVWGMTRTDHYLLYLWRGRLEFPQLCHQIGGLAAAWRPHHVLVEDASSGQALLQALRQQTRLNLLAVKPDTDKLTRVLRHTATLEAQRVLLPEAAPWLPDLESELFSFPNSEFDDQVDSITQFLQYAFEHEADRSYLDLDFSRLNTPADFTEDDEMNDRVWP